MIIVIVNLLLCTRASGSTEVDLEQVRILGDEIQLYEEEECKNSSIWLVSQLFVPFLYVLYIIDQTWVHTRNTFISYILVLLFYEVYVGLRCFHVYISGRWSIQDKFQEADEIFKHAILRQRRMIHQRT